MCFYEKAFIKSRESERVALFIGGYPWVKFLLIQLLLREKRSFLMIMLPKLDLKLFSKCSLIIFTKQIC